MSATTDRLPVYAPGLTLGDVFLRLRARGLTDARVRDLVLIVGGALLIAIGAWPDVMPLDEGIGQDLPAANIR